MSHESLHVEVAREFARNYHSFIHGKKHRANKQDEQKKNYAEEIESAKQLAHLADKPGFS